MTAWFSVNSVRSTCIALCVFMLLCCAGSADAQEAGEAPTSKAVLSVSDFLPPDYSSDGSVSYQEALQQAIDEAGKQHATLAFPPMHYLLDEHGLELRSGVTYSMYGAVFQFDDQRDSDGQAFHGENLRDVRMLGGEIVGRYEDWGEGVNIRGLYLTGASRNIRIRDLHTHGLSSNGVGIFAEEETPARDVWVTDCILEDGCNHYGDYLTERGGPEKGSVRQDQGLIAFYHVDDFVVRGCRFEKSRSDGTHFYKCRQGQFVHNKVYSAQMGGYFLETCEDVTASDNLIRDNGSRGVTIERGSRRCTLKGNVVANSGREGLWAPNCVGLVVTGNIFDRNGRKPNGDQPRHIWNANITINDAKFDPTKSATEDYLICDNILYTTDSQVAAVRIDAAVSQGIVIRDNLLRGENHKLLVEGDPAGRVTLDNNE